jgi:hypothetical protein
MVFRHVNKTAMRKNNIIIKIAYLVFPTFFLYHPKI